jgi:serine/threonine-protein kinase
MSNSSSVAFTTTVPPDFIGHPRYELLEPTANGGLGPTYRARDLSTDRIVAVEILPQAIAGLPEFVEAFRQKVAILTQLNHLNIAAVYEAGTAGEAHFLVKEFIEGENLDTMVRSRGLLELGEASDLIRQAARGLQHAHEHGLVHGDLNPRNLVVTSYGVLKIVDFGVLRDSNSSVGDSITDPDFMAPETARNPLGKRDSRSDLYSLGCTFYFLLAGSVPFPRATTQETIVAQQDEHPPSLRKFLPSIPAPTQEIVERLLAKDPAHRFQTPAELVDALSGSTFVGSRRARQPLIPLWLIVGWIAMAAVIFYSLYRLMPDSAEKPDSGPKKSTPEVLAMPREVETLPMPREVRAP